MGRGVTEAGRTDGFPSQLSGVGLGEDRGSYKRRFVVFCFGMEISFLFSFSARSGVFFLSASVWPWLAHGWAGKKGCGHVAFLFWCLLCYCHAGRWLGPLRLV